MSPKVKAIVEALRTDMPDIVVIENESGFKLTAITPQRMKQAKAFVMWWPAKPDALEPLVASAEAGWRDSGTNPSQPVPSADKSQDNNSEVDESGQA